MPVPEFSFGSKYDKIKKNVQKRSVDMWIFSTREIAIFIYAIILLGYVLLHKKGKSILLPVIKAACKIKLIIPFLIVLLYASLFVWTCTYLPFWNWVYLKDIVCWTIFVGVPVCFNATDRQLEKYYFRDIFIDNLKLMAVVEFLTGTFTFHIVIELILQPMLVFFVVLQSESKKNQIKPQRLLMGLLQQQGL